jgi:hypothetical protein
MMTSMITFHAPGSGQQHISEGADGYMAMIPFDEEYAVDWLTHLQDASYADITQVISKGFTVRFPEDTSVPSANDQQFSQVINRYHIVRLTYNCTDGCSMQALEY